MAFVCQPNKEMGNDGCVYMCRVSKEVEYQQKTHLSIFDSNQCTNDILSSSLGSGAINLPQHLSTKTLSELRDWLWNEYGLAEEIVNRIVLSYRTFKNKRGGGTHSKSSPIYISDENTLISSILSQTFNRHENSEPCLLTLDDLCFQVEYLPGDTRVEDCTCDSAFMLDVLINEAGPAIRDKFKYLEEGKPPGSPTEVLYLQMDNAGGHGTNEAKEQYKQQMLAKYNIIVEFQPPRSPELNLLDLGLWVSMQSAVEKLISRNDFRESADAIYSACKQVFNNFDASIIQKVYDRLSKKVWSLVVLDRGDNTKVEQCRGKLTVDPYMAAE